MSTPPAPAPAAAAPTTNTAPAPAPAAPAGGQGGGSGNPPGGPGQAQGPGAPGGQNAPQQPAGTPGAAPDPAPSTVGAGDGASEATARTGQGSLRAGLLRTAWTHVAGDRVDGDKIVINASGERGVVLRALAADTVETVRHTFQAPPRWDDVVADAWQRRSVVLRGPGGAGKTAAAVRLLISARATTFYLVDSVAELTRITELRQLAGGAGLLLDRPADLGDLRGSQLAGLEDLLRQADARLVLIAQSESELGTGVGEYVQRVARPEALDAVLRAHLAHRLGEPEADGALASAGVEDLTGELLGAATACREAARLAEVLAHEHGAGTIDPERVRSRMDHTGGESPEEWFEGLGDTTLRTQAVALAVLGGLPQEHVSMAASSLLDRFRSDRGYLAATAQQGPVPLREDPFSQSGRLYAAQLRARTVSAVVRGDLGRLPCTVAEYRDPDYPPRIIRHAWTQYRIQRELLDWLAELVDRPSQQVRSFTGTALGLIAGESFDHIATQVFPGWVRHGDNGYWRREAVAYALRVCVRDPQLRPGVRALVEGWYMSGTWQFQAAAARAYGLCLGGADLGTAVQALTRLGTVDHIKVAIEIGDAFADLMEENVAEHAPVVLRALAEMAHEPASRPSGHLAFLIVADLLATDEPSAAGTARRSRPTLLRLAAEQPPGHELRRLLGYLWSEVMGGELFSDQAVRVLEAWAAQAEADPQLLDDMVRTLVEDVAARSTRVAILLERCTARWTDRDRFRPLPRSAAVLGAALRAHSARTTQPGGGR